MREFACWRICFPHVEVGSLPGSVLGVKHGRENGKRTSSGSKAGSGHETAWWQDTQY